MKKIVLLLTLCFVTQVWAEKYCLIIAIGDYPRTTGWGAINSVNDIDLIRDALLGQDFKPENISVIKNEEATKQGILNALENLKSKIKPGDIVVIHYSGHGQQVFDENGDETDNLDESLVPIDAFVKYTSYYKGENHIRDDELGNIIATFRNTLGKNGQLMLLLDSCHSGTASRGGVARGGKPALVPPNWSENNQSKSPGSGLLEEVEIGQDASPFIMFTGASANELNYEYDGHGSLSFAFSKAMNELGNDFTYRKLFAGIATNMNVIAPNQTPTMEGDPDLVLFKGEYVKQQPYFAVKKIVRPGVLRINAGKLQGLFEGTTVNILPAGTAEVKKEEIITTGKITNANFNESTITLDQPVETNNVASLWVFIDQPSYGDLSVRVNFMADFKDKNVKKELEDYLQTNQLGEVVKDENLADLVIGKDASGQYELYSAKGLRPFELSKRIKNRDPVEVLKETLAGYAQGNYLKNLNLKNYDYEFDFKLLPAKINKETRDIEYLEEDAFIDDRGVFVVRPKSETRNTSDEVILQVTNKSDRPLYFSIVEINSLGEINPFMPNNSCRYYQLDDERKIAPGATIKFSRCKYDFYPPYETLILKAFATPTPINFKPTIRSRGEGNTRAVPNRIERLVKGTYVASRGSGSGDVDDGSSASQGLIDGFSSEFVYEIKN